MFVTSTSDMVPHFQLAVHGHGEKIRPIRVVAEVGWLVGWLVGLKKRPKKICSCDKKVWDLNVNSKNFEKISILVFVQTVFCFPCLLFCFLLHLSSSFIVCRMIPLFLPAFVLFKCHREATTPSRVRIRRESSNSTSRIKV